MGSSIRLDAAPVEGILVGVTNNGMKEREYDV